MEDDEGPQWLQAKLIGVLVLLVFASAFVGLAFAGEFRMAWAVLGLLGLFLVALAILPLTAWAALKLFRRPDVFCPGCHALLQRDPEGWSVSATDGGHAGPIYVCSGCGGKFV